MSTPARPFPARSLAASRLKRHFALLATTLVASRADAQSLYWSGGSGDWDATTPLWSATADGAGPLQLWDNTTPASAVFGLGAGTVSLSAPASASGLVFTTDGYTLAGETLTLASSYTTVDTGSGTQTIASALAGFGILKTGSGTLRLTAANTLAAESEIREGGVILSGVGASLGVTGTAARLDIGTFASASLRVEAGATLVTTYSSVGSGNAASTTATVTGSGSTWTADDLTLGTYAGDTGALILSDGGHVTDQHSTIGYSGVGSVTVTGVGSVWTTAGLRFGLDTTAEGTLDILDGGVVNHTGSIGMSNAAGVASHLTVDGAGSLLTSTSSLQAGNFGPATVVVSNGGKIASGGGSIGGYDGGRGDVTITGVGSQWALGTGGLSMDGDSSLVVSDGATVTGGGSLIANYAGQTSTITIGGNGASWAVAGGLVLGDLGDAVVNVQDGGSLSTTLHLRLGQDAAGSGTIIQTGGTVTAGSYLHFGPGHSVYRLEGGTLRVGTSYGIYTDANTGTYVFELAGGTIQATSSMFSTADATLRADTESTFDTPGSRYISWGDPDQDEGYLSGSGSLKKIGTGTLYLNLPNTYSGGTKLQQGVLNVVNGGLGTGRLAFSGNSTLQVDWENTAFAGSVTIDPGVTATVEVAGSNLSLALSGDITGAGGLTKTGTGVLVLGGANDYAGPTAISGGLVRFSNAGNFGPGSITLNGGGLQWAAGNTTDISADPRLAAIGSGGATFHTNGNDVTFAQPLSGAGGLVKTGAGALTLSVANTYAGPTTLSAGALVLGHDDALGSNTLSLNGGSLRATGSARVLANAVTLAANSTIDGSTALTFTNTLVNSGGNRTLTVNNGALTTLGAIQLSNNTTGRTLTLAGSGDVLVSGVISNRAGAGSNPGSLTKSGAGTLTLAGLNTYTGATTVSAGRLHLTGSSASSAFTVRSGATLSGTGVAGSTTVLAGGTLAPGAGSAAGLFGVNGDLVLDSGGFTTLDIAGLVRGASDGYDAIDVAGAFTAGGTLAVVFTNGYTPAGPATFDLFDFASFGGSFAQVNLPTIGGYTWNTSQLSIDGTLSLVASAIPEPASFASLAALAGGLFASARRRRLA